LAIELLDEPNESILAPKKVIELLTLTRKLENGRLPSRENAQSMREAVAITPVMDRMLMTTMTDAYENMSTTCASCRITVPSSDAYQCSACRRGTESMNEDVHEGVASFRLTVLDHVTNAENHGQQHREPE
jgi:uncharacterized protein involved in copper resistance